MTEIWKDITNYNGFYRISNLGRIMNKRGLVMRQHPSKDGYVRILLYGNGKYKSEYVHILVANAFIPNPDNKPEVNHIDANKSHNSSDNLEWVTSSENHFHAVAHGLKPVNPTLGKHGSDNPCTKPIYQYDMQGNFIKMWRSREDAARYYDCPKNSLSRCINGVRRSCRGFIWKRTPPA